MGEFTLVVLALPPALHNRVDGENHFARLPTTLYGANLLACAVAYSVLQNQLISHHGKDSSLAGALGKDFKGKVSFVLYGLGTAAAWFIAPWIAITAFAAVALLWLVPDRRMEAAMARRHTAS